MNDVNNVAVAKTAEARVFFEKDDEGPLQISNVDLIIFFIFLVLVVVACLLYFLLIKKKGNGDNSKAEDIENSPRDKDLLAVAR